MDKQTALLLVFGAYVASIPCFGVAYFLLYRRRRTNFVFAGEIHSARLFEEKQRADDRISWLCLLLDFFEQFAQDHQKGTARQERTENTATLHLSDGRSIILEKQITHMPQGGDSELAPLVRLLRANGIIEQERNVAGHGWLSDFADWRDYVIAAVTPRHEDLRQARAHRSTLDSPQPTIWRYLDFVYFSTVTQSTVGYGDILPNSAAVRSIVVLQLIWAYALLVYILNLVLST